MTAATALIVHELMDSPLHWTDRGDGVITNGYYNVSLDGMRYGMGSSMYSCTGSEIDILRKAVAAWKEETGWQPKQPAATQASQGQDRNARMTPDVYVRKAYEQFAYSIRSAYRSYKVHSDQHVLSSSMEQSINALDLALKPVEAIEGKKRNQEGGQGSGIPSA